MTKTILYGELKDGDVAFISGYRFRVTNLRVATRKGETFVGGVARADVIRFEGVCVGVSDIVSTPYNGGTYGAYADVQIEIEIEARAGDGEMTDAEIREASLLPIEVVERDQEEELRARQVKTTRSVAGFEIALTPGVRYRASRPWAERGRRYYTVSIAELVTRGDEEDVDGVVVQTISGLSYDESNRLLEAFNDGPTSFEGRVW